MRHGKCFESFTRFVFCFVLSCARVATLSFVVRQLYSGGLSACDEDSSEAGVGVRATVLTNRAMVLFKQGKVMKART